MVAGASRIFWSVALGPIERRSREVQLLPCILEKPAGIEPESKRRKSSKRKKSAE